MVENIGESLRAMPLHTITQVYGFDGLKERFDLELLDFSTPDKQQLRAGYELAETVHAEDRRQSEPYINHLLRVAIRLHHHYEVSDVDVVTAGLLHDAIEDHTSELNGGESEDRKIIDSKLTSQSSHLKIGFVIDDGLDSTDGVQQYVLTFGRYMQSRGHEVHYLAGETKRQNLKNLHVLSKNLKVSFNANRLSTPLPASGKRIKQLLSQEKFDILHVQIPYSPVMAARVVAAAPKSTRIVATFHVLPYSRLQKRLTQLLGLYMRRNFMKFDKVLAVSGPAAEFCRQVFGHKPVILPNAIDLGKYSSPRPATNNQLIKIVFLGRLVERKGCLQLIKAVDHIVSRKLTARKFSVEIGGSGPDKKALEQMIKQCNLEGLVTLCGFINEQHKSAFLGQAEIAVFPSLSGESFGIVLLEAMAAGAGVVIGGDNPGYRSVFDSMPECLVNAKKPSDLAKKLSELINNPQKRSQLHTRQQRLIKQYDISKVGKQLEEVYYEP